MQGTKRFETNGFAARRNAHCHEKHPPNGVVSRGFAAKAENKVKTRGSEAYIRAFFSEWEHRSGRGCIAILYVVGNNKFKL
jgi:hypothetical protein